MIQSTSLQALLHAAAHLPASRKAVYDLLKQGEMTNAEMAGTLGWPVNRVTPRTHELVNRELVEEARKRPCRITGNTAIAWRARPLVPARPELPPAYDKPRQLSL